MVANAVLDKQKSRGKNEKETELLLRIYLLLYIFFTSKPVTRTTRQVHPTSEAYSNNRVLLLMALPCDRLFLGNLMFTANISPRT